MSSAVRILKGKFSECVCRSCKGTKKCKLLLNNFPSKKVILDIDCIEQQRLAQIQGKRCDYIIVIEQAGSTFLIPVEFKTRSVRVNDVKEQLEGGIRFFAQSCQAQFELCPVLVSKRIGGTVGIGKKLQDIKVTYNSQEARIKHVRCDGSLSWDKVKNSKLSTHT